MATSRTYGSGLTRYGSDLTLFSPITTGLDFMSGGPQLPAPVPTQPTGIGGVIGGVLTDILSKIPNGGLGVGSIYSSPAPTIPTYKINANAAFRTHKRMNVCNARALKRAMRRVQGFAKFSRKCISFTQRVKMKKGRRCR